MTKTTSKNSRRWEFASKLGRVLSGCRGPGATLLWDRAVPTCSVQLQAPTWLTVRDEAWAGEPEDSHQGALCGWRREKGRECERVIGRGRKKGKSLPILSCSYRASLPRGFLHPPEMTKVKSQRDLQMSYMCLKMTWGKEGEDEEGTKELKLPIYRQRKEGTLAPPLIQ